ncbi:hypothetical protein ACWC5O_42350 [Streptomyces sp. NPDC001450]
MTVVSSSVTSSGQPHPAEPAEQMTPASAVYTASRRTCGGSYDKPWRRCTA